MPQKVNSANRLIHLELDIPTYRALKHVAVDRDVSLPRLLRRLVENCIAAHGYVVPNGEPVQSVPEEVESVS
jgi:hypothetical protein